MENNNQSVVQNDSILTFDEILEDKEYQSEFDKRVTKALETAKTKWQTSADVEKANAVKDATDALNAVHNDETAALNAQLKKALIGMELVKAKARDIEVVLPLIDAEKVTSTEAGLEGLADQIEALKGSKGYLFEVEQSAPPAKGKSGLNHNDGDPNLEDAKIKKIMGLPI